MKVGTRVNIIKTTIGCYGAEGLSGVVTDKESTNGLLNSHSGYNVECDNGEVWRINNEATVEILETPMPELEVGMFGITNADRMFVVVEKHGEKVLAYADGFMGFDYPSIGIKRLIKAWSFHRCETCNNRNADIIWEATDSRITRREHQIEVLKSEIEKLEKEIDELRAV